MNRPRRPWILSAIAAVVLSLATASATRADELEGRIVERLQRLVFTPPDRARMEMLAALRHLKDPALSPLFAQLAASDFPELRRQGMLGLAELSNPPQLNTLMLARLKDPVEQARVLGEALREELIGVEQMSEMVAWPGLDDYLSLVLQGRLMASGRAPDTARIRTFVQSDSPNVSVIARVLLAQSGSQEPIDPAFADIMGIERPRRDALIMFLTDHFRRERLTAAAELVARLLQSCGDERSLQIDLVRTLLSLEPAKGAPAWLSAYASAPDLSMRLRFAMVALDSSPACPADVFAALEKDQGEPLLRALGAACRAIAGGSGVAEALCALAAFGHNASTDWVAVHVDRVAPGAAVAVHRCILDWAAAQSSLPDYSFDAVTRASERLSDLDAGWLGGALSRACDARQRKLTRGVLSGVLRGAARPVWEVSHPPSWPDATSESLALIVEARADPRFGSDSARLDRLRQIALGVTDVPDRFRVMASWLALERGGPPEKALARILTAPK